MSKKQLTLLLALASAACTYNNASHATEAGEEDGMEETTTQSKLKATTKEASEYMMSIRTLSYCVVMSVGCLVEYFGGDMVRSLITNNIYGNYKAPMVGFGIVLAILSAAAVLIEDMVFERDEAKKGDYDFLFRTLSYFVAMSLGAGMLLNIDISTSLKIFGKDLVANDNKFYSWFAQYYLLHAFLIVLFSAAEASIESLVCGCDEASKSEK
jgi:hypothetical protein